MSFSFLDSTLYSCLTIILLCLPLIYLLVGKQPSPKTGLKVIGKTSNGRLKDEVRDGDPGQSLVSVPLGDIRVSKILVHPIKSCRGSSVEQARYTPEGLENDRKWCIVDANTHDVITAREVPKLVLVVPRLMPDSSSPYGGQLVVSVPTSPEDTVFSLPISPAPETLGSWQIISDCMMFKTFKVDGYICQSLSSQGPNPSEFLSDYIGRKVFLLMKGPVPRQCPPTLDFPDLKANSVFQDVYPLLVASEESLHEVSRAVREAAQVGEDQPGKIGGIDRSRWKDGELEMERFRPNIVIKGTGVPFAEEAMREIIIAPQYIDEPSSNLGLSVITLVSKCTRCLLPNVDTKTGVRDAAVPFKVLTKLHKDTGRTNKPLFGCNGVPSGSGIVRVGDYVSVKEWVTSDRKTRF